MLYDPKWEVKVDPLSLTSLVNWLTMQPTHAEYCFMESGNCVIAKWLRSIDPDFTVEFGPENLDCYIYRVHGRLVDFRDWDKIAISQPRTFGAALDRARDVLSR